MKKKKNKVSPDIGLATEQFEELNKDFYEGFSTDFYDIKIINLISLISDTDEYASSIISKKLKIEKLEVNLKEKLVNEDVKKFAKLEIAMTYYHCLETFIRLFLAHAKLSGCPWLELSRLTFRKYKSELKILSENNFKNLNKKFSGNETVLYVLTGQTKPLEGLSFEDVEGFKHWISWSAQQLLETYDYNSFKHGLAISPKNLGVKIIGNNNLTIQKQGEALEFIAKYEREDRYIWEKEILWIPYDSRAAIIITVSNIIKNIMTVGKAISFKESYTLEKLPKKELSPEFLLKNDNDPIFKVTSVKKGLLYYKID